jgi:hypothetical protein
MAHLVICSDYNYLYIKNTAVVGFSLPTLFLVKPTGDN